MDTRLLVTAIWLPVRPDFRTRVNPAMTLAA